MRPVRSLGLALLLAAGSATAAVERTTEPETGLAAWHGEAEGLSVTFNQRLPDQSRAYFQGRGFRPEEAELVAQRCVFQAIVRNGSDAAPVRLDLAEWRVTGRDGAPRPLRLEADWQAEWERRAVSQSARIAFRWSLFPTRQAFQPGDWNMGMITPDLGPDEAFDLEVVWHAGETPRRLRFERMRCAPDRHV